MMKPVRFGVTLPQIKRTWTESRDAAVAFDAMGFDSLWVCDHVYGVPMPQLPILEAWSQLAAVAAVTERAKLGTLVTPPFFRNPAILAKQMATIDHISDGRVIAGLGAGWFQPEFEGTGSPFPSTRERLRALEEMIQILKGMWTEPTFSFEGQHFQVKDVVCEPKPATRPEILVGGGGEKVLMGIVAKHADTWNNMAVFQSQLASKIEALKRRCDDFGRDFDELEISQQCTIVIAEDDDAAKASLAKASKVYGGHMGGQIEEHGIWGSPDAVIERIEKHRALGVNGFIIEFFGRDTREPARLFAEKVMPAISSAG